MPIKIREIGDFTKKYAARRKDGSTAFVFSCDVDFEIGRMIEAYLQLGGFSVTTKCFQNIESAYERLGIEPPESS
ncbi:MAG: hypothetical protein JXB48_00890 [Candidatus Latescibacteria bacterium]|nr:hypothetical protein [Candidatus Latescibacterota bacterium]